MDPASNNWSTVPRRIIKKLAGYLKRTKRWSRDGRSLRALNTHWCAAINGHIFEVRPHLSRVLHDEDIDSLLKFRNLTFLDTVPFQGNDDSGMGDRCRKLAQVIGKLPRVKHIRLKSFLDHMEGPANPWFIFPTLDILQLKSITKIDFDDRKLVANEDLSKISCLPVKEMAGRFHIGYLSDYIQRMPSLKVVLAPDMAWSGKWDDVHRFYSIAKGLDAVSFRLPAGQLNMRIAEMHSLQSLELYNGPSKSIDPLVGLLKLTSLKMTIEDGDIHARHAGILASNAFQQLMKRLISLKIRTIGTTLFPNDAFKGATALKILSLYGTELQEGCMDNFQKLPLTELSLKHCTIKDGHFSIEGFTKLRRLHLKGIRDDNLNLGGLMLSPLQDLRTLKLGRSNKWLTSKLLKEICSLVNLESLSIYFDDSNCDEPDFSFNAFEALGDLPRLSYLGISGCISKEEFVKVVSTKMLMDLEELSFDIIVKGTDCPSVLSKLSALKWKAPHLKFIASVEAPQTQRHELRKRRAYGENDYIEISPRKPTRLLECVDQSGRMSYGLF